MIRATCGAPSESFPCNRGVSIVLKINMPNGAVLEPELLQVNSIARAAELLSRLKITDLAYVDPIVLKYFWSNR
mgnify:CR=1 FL=1